MNVLFVQYTPKGELAKRLREKLEAFERLGSLRFKVVEKTGSKLEEILHKSDAWNDRDCDRKDCLLCSSAGEEERRGMCKRKNVVYETYCITCYENEKNKKDEQNIYMFNCENVKEHLTNADIVTGKRKRGEDEKKKMGTKEGKGEKKRRKEYRVKYVGETGRSAYERGVEHLSDFLNFDEGSHLLKHYLTYHKDLKMSDVKFGMKVRNTFRTAIERQVGEAVAIDIEQRKGLTLMNSKSEYNRCSIPRITTKSVKETVEENDKETLEEKKMKNEIKLMKRMKGKKRENYGQVTPKNDENIEIAIIELAKKKPRMEIPKNSDFSENAQKKPKFRT